MTATPHWVATFRSTLVDPIERIRLAEPRGFADHTVRQVLHLVGGGARLRVRLTNRYGATPVTIGAARIAVRKSGAEIVTETDTALLFDGKTHTTIPAGADIISDTVDFATTAGMDLALSVHLPDETGPAPFSHLPMESSYVADGDQTAAVALSDAEEATSRFYVTGADVLTTADAPIVVAFGDSWFEGVGSTSGANRRSVDVLNARLTTGWVLNQGISGTRLLTDQIGEHGLARFDRDVLDVPGVTHVVLNFGINDLILDNSTASAADLIAGFTALAERAHAAGLAVYANTIGPFAGVIYPDLNVAEGRVVRRQVNEWLRTTAVFDAVFDIAAAVENPDDPDFIRPDLDSGDGLHLNDAGHQIMGETMNILGLTD
ncbi:GDSL-type esterase/lipase family protein [Nocardia sp. NBC_00565]|uniref:GDSL-type esterase/lipase family protein n=1 Tax=Nocardia sp. NBC_00565 TaxID=2975993 RepID=UPI002E8227E3|nr:GDSL-type esterase/lipase family protein [Nocardia sp. NBC_00565]WUC01064.1 GDSL-type esterase/lipase family protein [Nocardia sp. NBC_00565]